MKITKYNHSCLLVEENGTVALIDPGNYSAAILPIDTIEKLDYLLITHQHQDHFDVELVKKLVSKFPQVKIIAASPVVEILKLENIPAVVEGDENVAVTPIPHEKVWGGDPGENIMVTLFKRLAHPGDSHTFTTDAEILALPVTAPWGSTTRAIEIAQELKPKIIIPIHDWHWKDEARKGMYHWIGSFLSSLGIDFKAIENAETITI